MVGAMVQAGDRISVTCTQAAVSGSAEARRHARVTWSDEWNSSPQQKIGTGLGERLVPGSLFAPL